MALFPGDMNIGWGFGLEADEADCRFIMAQPDEPQEEGELDDDSQLSITPLGREYLAELEAKEPHLTDPLLAVSELEQRVNDLEERLRSLTIVVSDVVERNENLERVIKNVLIARIGRKEKE